MVLRANPQPDPYARQQGPVPEGSTRLGPANPFAPNPAGPFAPDPRSPFTTTVPGGNPAQMWAVSPETFRANGGNPILQGQPPTTILRERGTRGEGAYQNRPDLWVGKTADRRSDPLSYEGEYWEKALKDPVKRQWLADRAIVLGFANYNPKFENGIDPAEFNTNAGGVYQMWRAAGERVMMNRELNKLTPEEFLDGLYGQYGGDNSLAAKIADAPKEENPIQTITQTYTSTMSKAAAEAAADQIASAVLGRMATQGEMAKARKAMNALLKANPSVSTTTTDRTDPDNVKSSTVSKEGASAADAKAAYEMKLRRSSEGMAFNVGKLMESAMGKLDAGL